MRKRGSGVRLRVVRLVTRRRISATGRPSRQSTTVSFRSSTALTSWESRVLASCMLTMIMLANLANMADDVKMTPRAQRTNQRRAAAACDVLAGQNIEMENGEDDDEIDIVRDAGSSTT